MIRIWDAETGIAVGRPLEGHTESVLSVAYSPDGRHIISGSVNNTIRIWDADTGTAVNEPLEGHTESVSPVAYPPDGQHIVSGTRDQTTRVWESFLREPPSSCSPMHPHLLARPNSEGWVRDSDRGLLYWVPLDCRSGLHSPALITIPLTSSVRSVSLDFDDFAFGTSWTQIFGNAQR